MSGKQAASILLVEDSDTDAEMTLRALNRCQMVGDVRRVRDGAEALALLRQEGPFADSGMPDLVLLDLNMPNVDGRQVLHEMRDDRKLQMVPVIVLTTSEAVTDVMMSYALSANAYVVKSFDFSTFCDSIRKLCEFWLTVAVYPPK